jgi:hypothetical protein
MSRKSGRMLSEKKGEIGGIEAKSFGRTPGKKLGSINCRVSPASNLRSEVAGDLMRSY